MRALNKINKIHIYQTFFNVLNFHNQHVPSLLPNPIQMPALNPDLCAGSVDAMAAHDKRHLKAKLLAESKPSKMLIVEEATPQAFKEAVGTSSVSNRRKQAELKHLARIARARCAHR